MLYISILDFFASVEPVFLCTNSGYPYF